MDPMTSIGLACNVIQVITFSVDTAKVAHEVYKSTSGQSKSNQALREQTEKLSGLLENLQSLEKKAQQSDVKVVRQYTRV